MKKLLIMIIFSIFLLGIGISGRNYEKAVNTYQLYVPSGSINNEESSVKIIETGAFDIASGRWDELEHIKSNLDDILGGAVKMKGDENTLNYIIKDLDVKVVSRSMVDDKLILYGYSKKLGEGVKHNGKIVNIQLNCGNNMVEIGTPLIMGSY